MLMRGESERYRNRINRTILECKGFICYKADVLMPSVLIEPYWNVKEM